MAMHLLLLKIGVGCWGRRPRVCVGCQVTYEVLGELTVSGERGSGKPLGYLDFCLGVMNHPPGLRPRGPGRAVRGGRARAADGTRAEAAFRVVATSRLTRRAPDRGGRTAVSQ
jgi:hypothetical protein